MSELPEGLEPARSSYSDPVRRALAHRRDQLEQDRLDAERWLSGRGRLRSLLRRLVGQ